MKMPYARCAIKRFARRMRCSENFAAIGTEPEAIASYLHIAYDKTEGSR
jgi:hypothetical protein